MKTQKIKKDRGINCRNCGEVYSFGKQDNKDRKEVRGDYKNKVLVPK